MSHRRHHGHHRGCSPQCTSVRHELLDLSNHLRQERLYVQHEKIQLQELNEKVKTASEKLSHTAWIAHQQRENLDGLIFSSRGHESSPSHCCLRANVLEQTIFQDAYKHLGHQEILYAEFLRVLRNKPKLLARCLAAGDKLGVSNMSDIVSTIFSGLYGSCLMPDDEVVVLRLLRHLMKIQLTPAPNPRKLLRQGNCAFSRIYKSLSEELFSAKLFLTSALYEPILSLLSDDEIFLDIDPSKAVIRFPPSDRLKKFGREGTPEFEKNLKQHRNFVVTKLECLTNSFIQGIRDNLHCFPPSLARLLRNMYRLLMSSGHAEPREVNAVCVDVIFYLFICPAMVDPNPVGIIDTPISYIARSNLMQVAQILQVLAMWKWEEIDPRLMDLYSRFDKEAMSTVLEVMLESANDLGTSDDDDEEDFIDGDDQGANINDDHANNAENSNGHDSPSDSSSASCPRLARMAVLLSRSQLTHLVTFLQTIRDAASSNVTLTEDDIDGNQLTAILSPLPDIVPGLPKMTLHPTCSTPMGGTPIKAPTSSKSDESLVSMAAAKKQLLTHKLSNVATTVSSRASALSSNMRSSIPSLPTSPDDSTSTTTTAVAPVASSGHDSVDCPPTPILRPEDNRTSEATRSYKSMLDQEPEVVMVIPLYEGRCDEPPGFLPEDHVISHSRQSSGSRVVRMNLANLPGEEDHDAGHHRRHSGGTGAGGGNSEENSSFVSGGAGEKRTRFSLSHDDGSIGNTSDNLEAISEAASNHSVDSSLEDEDDPVEDPIIDNLSDMVSANVSGRGTPNVSGRDTPSSQVTEGDELVGGAEGAGAQGGAKGVPEAPRGRSGSGEGGQQERAHAARGTAERNEQQVAGANRGGAGGGASGGRKNGEPDLEEKFGRFEIKPQTRPGGSGGHNMSLTGAAGSEQGDETISMVSDTWSTDVLASDTETLGDADGLMHQHQHILLLHQRRQARGLPGLGIAGSSLGHQVEHAGGNRNVLDDLVESPPHGGRGSGNNENVTPSSARHGIEGSSGSLGSASAANLLDMSETCSDAWSMDVLASDTESLRLAELDNEDTASVARSDDTRFTDDTTRSDPEAIMDLSGVSVTSGMSRGVALSSSSHGARYRRDDVTLVKRGLSGDGGNLLRPSRVAAVEQWARQSSGPRANLIPRRGSECSGGRSMIAQDGSLSEKSKPVENEVATSSENRAQRTSEATASTSTAASIGFITSHLSATSIASSTESSAGESGTGFSVTAHASSSNPATESSSAIGASLAAEDDGALRCLIDGEIEISGGAAAAPVPTSTTAHHEAVAEISLPPTLSKSVSHDGPVGEKSKSLTTGAIPKSISFDKTVKSSNNSHHNPPSPSADWQDGEHGGHQGAKNKKRDNSFFKSWKLPKIGRNRLQQPQPPQQLPSGPGVRGSRQDFRFSAGNDVTDEQGPSNAAVLVDFSSVPHVESSDDILAKYRKRAPLLVNASEDALMGELSSSNEVILHEGNRSQDDTDFNEDVDNRLVIEPLNIEASFAFQDAKRKLRMMLSEADLTILSSLPMTSSGSAKSKHNELVWLLRVQLAEAHNLQDRNLVAQLHETLRCLSLFDNESCRKLIRSLREDYKRRSPYLSYLVRCRQGLLTTLAHQERILSRMEMDRRVCMAYLISVCIRLFLERRERELSQFVAQFKAASAADEKISLMERFLAELWSQLEADSSSMMWSLMVSEDQQDVCRLTVERTVVSQIYVHAMYPNGEADSSRDEVLASHIRRLAEEITPGHRDLRIPRQYHYEQPWPSAQAEIRRLAAYKTPQDKVACVVRCSQTIMNLLSLASSKSVPAADDFVPVMVFVIIMANPPSLLSTVQYVESFYGNRLCGEEQYWWMQFASAIEFIKTMDYQNQQ